MELKDLKEASFNPRIISAKRLDNLHRSMTTYGDLSGVVFNKKTKNLVSGHQRLKRLRDKGIKTKIVTKPVRDEFGTVEEGHIIAKTSAGTLRIPLRIVEWSDKKAEMAANIAANAHGGDFDKSKLGVLLEKLDAGKTFDIELVGLDPLSVRNLLPKMPTVGKGNSSSADDEDSGESFQEYGEDSFEFEHTCPKCKFQFNSSKTPKKPAKPEPKAPKLSKAKAEAKAKKADKPKKKKSKK